MPSVKLPTQLREAAGGASSVRVEGATVAEVLASLFEEHGELRRFVNVYVSGEDIRFADGLETEVAAGSEVMILPAVAGG